MTTDITSFDYGKSPEEIAAAQQAAAAGVQQTKELVFDFWGNTEKQKYFFPGQDHLNEDKKQWIEFKTMTEGDRARFQKMTNSGVTIERATNNARMSVDPARDRHALFEVCITNWRLLKDGEEVRFVDYQLKNWLKFANPKFIDELERAIRKSNPWMVAELKAEDIRKEIDLLEEQYQEALVREQTEKDF